MYNKIILFIILIILTNCSVDTKTGFWENKNQLNKTVKLSDLSFEYDLTFEKFKEIVIQYGKIGDYPDLGK